MIRNVNLIEHLPLFIQEFKEIKNIMNTENPELQLVINESERVKNNQFVQTSDLVGVQRFEKLLNIRTLEDDNLQSRVSRIMNRWNDVVPYSVISLIEKLDALCGSGNYSIEENFNQYKLSLVVHLALSGQVDELEYMLAYMVPVNLEIFSSNELNYQATGTIYMASNYIKVNTFEITSELNTVFTAQGSLKNGSTLIKVLDYTIN